MLRVLRARSINTGKGGKGPTVGSSGAGGSSEGSSARSSAEDALGSIATPPVVAQRRQSLSLCRPRRVVQASPKRKVSVVARVPDQQRVMDPPAPVHERSRAAAAFVFRSCNVSQSGSLLRWEFATAIEMMMRQKLVAYLLEQIDAARIDAEFEEAAQGAEECGLESFTEWFAKFDLYLLEFYPEPQTERKVNGQGSPGGSSGGSPVGVLRDHRRGSVLSVGRRASLSGSVRSLSRRRTSLTLGRHISSNSLDSCGSARSDSSITFGQPKVLGPVPGDSFINLAA